MPSPNGARIPRLLIAITVPLCFNMRSRSTYSPTVNIKSSNPSWLKAASVVREEEGNRCSKTDGKNIPSTEGPSTMPAIISATTLGCPNRCKRKPAWRATNKIVLIEIMSCPALTYGKPPPPRNQGSSRMHSLMCDEQLFAQLVFKRRVGLMNWSTRLNGCTAPLRKASRSKR